MTILLVDDKADNLYLLEKVLQGRGYQTATALHGAQALSLALAHPPDLVVSDILMPVMDGFTLCREWRRSEKLMKIPFLFYTATYTDPKDEEFALSLGADRFLVKPKEPREFLAVIQEVLAADHAGGLQRKRAQGPEEKVFLVEYNETLVRKLENKVRAMETAEKELRAQKAALQREIEERRLAEETLSLLSHTVTSINECISITTSRNTILFVNEAFLRTYGYTQEELLDKPISIIVAKNNISESEIFQRTLAGGWKGEVMNRKKDGTLFPVSLSTSVVYDENRKPIGFVGVAVDITEKKRAEEELRASEGRYRAIYESSNTAIMLTVPGGEVISANESACRLFGMTEAEIIRGGRDAIVDATDPRLGRLLAQRAKTGRATGELRFRRKDGTWFEGEISTSIFPDKEGNPTSSIIIKDLTERKEMEAALRRNEELYRTVFENTGTATVMIEENTIISLANVEFERLSGFSKDEVQGKRSWKEFVVPEDLERMRMQHDLRRKAPREALKEYEFRFQRRDGTLRDILLTIDLIPGTLKSVASLRDITERRTSERKIEEQARLLDVTRDAIIVRDMNDKLIYLNRAASELYGWSFEEGENVPSENLVIPGDREKYRQQIADFTTTGSWEGELRQQTKDGRQLDILTRWDLVRDKDGNPVARLIINRDITEQRRLEAQFRRAQRLESLGTLAGGIAHDLNNVLAPITMSLALLDRKVTDPGLKKHIRTLEASAQRGSEIIKQVLLFARGSEKDFAPQQLRYLIGEIRSIIYETFPKSIVLQTEMAKDLRFVRGDATQLHQVLMNLCVNARDAMPQGGKLTITAVNATLTEMDTKAHPGSSIGDYVVLGVSDTGTGIPKHLQEKIFEPFFTTKETGKGTGLGLSTVYAIVKDHGGFIHLYSEEEKGTEFKIFIPALKEEKVVETREEVKLHADGKGEVVLVVDDEEAVLEITRVILEAHGYRVLTATNGAEAVQAFTRAQKGSIHVLLTDVSMPVMDGPTAVKAIRAIDPEVRVIIASGLIADLDQVAMEKLRVDGYLMKPYTTDRMLGCLHQAIHDPTPKR
jgi:PAS domain S-box-containing protein